MSLALRPKQLGFGCLVLFMLPFEACGVGFTYWVFHLVNQHKSMQSWPEVPAVLKHVELKNVHAENSATYQAIAEYEYEYDGRKFLGDRVGLFRVSDNFGSFQRDAHAELHRHLKQKKPFRAYVNPANPAESILYRNMRWEFLAFFTIFAAVFGSAGIGGLVGILASARAGSYAAVQDAPQDQPWLARSDWSSGRIRPAGSAFVAVPVLASATFFWWLASIPLLSQLPTILPPEKQGLAWLTLAFPAIGLVLLAALVHQFLRKQKFGRSTLELASTPGVIGGQLAGVVRIERIIQAEAGYRLKLSCVEQVRKSNDNTVEEVLWQDEQLVTEPMRDIATGTMALPVLFVIPYAAKETSHGDSKRDIDWRLEVSGKMPGVDFKSRFEVPVFKTPESRSDFKLDEKLSADFTARPSNDLLLREAGIVKERLAGKGVRLVFPAARNLGSAIVVTIVLAFWTVVVWFLFHVEAPIFFPIIFGLFELLFVWVAVELWFYRSVVHATVEGLKYRGGYFGIGRTHSWKANEIRRFSTEDSMSSGTKVWKHVVLVPKEGKNRKIGRTIPGKLAQQAVIDELNAALRRTDSGGTLRR